MTALPDYTAWGIASLLLCATLLLLRRPLAQLIRLVLRSSVGLAVLAVLAPLGHGMGISLGVNLTNALVLGVLGAPGLGLLLMLQWALR